MPVHTPASQPGRPGGPGSRRRSSRRVASCRCRCRQWGQLARWSSGRGCPVLPAAPRAARRSRRSPAPRSCADSLALDTCAQPRQRPGHPGLHRRRSFPAHPRDLLVRQILFVPTRTSTRMSAGSSPRQERRMASRRGSSSRSSGTAGSAGAGAPASSGAPADWGPSPDDWFAQKRQFHRRWVRAASRQRWRAIQQPAPQAAATGVAGQAGKGFDEDRLPDVLGGRPIRQHRSAEAQYFIAMHPHQLGDDVAPIAARKGGSQLGRATGACIGRGRVGLLARGCG